MTRTSPLRRRESLTRIGVDKAIYAASEKISDLIYSSAFPTHSMEGYIDLWELESAVSAILTETVNELTTLDPATGEEFLFEAKNRPSLIDDMVTLILDCVKDAFGSSIEIEYPTPRIIFLKSLWSKSKSFIKREFRLTIYEMLIRLIKK
ncbi:MAG: hypothetical protein N3D12_01460 [Candidatus Methanomethyliaceae archaeon]|nr:hypothetical protein [Candidatus Methanomethyliaceae archaeon]